MLFSPYECCVQLMQFHISTRTQAVHFINILPQAWLVSKRYEALSLYCLSYQT